MTSIKALRVCAVIALAFSIFGCAQQDVDMARGMVNDLTKDLLPESQRQTLLGITDDAGAIAVAADMSEGRQQALGQELANEVLTAMRRSSHGQLENYLNRIIDRISRKLPPRRYDYTLYLIENRQVNAFTTGGGYVFVTTGLVGCLDNEAQMAMVLGHELAHITESHLAQANLSGTLMMVSERRVVNNARSVTAGKVSPEVVASFTKYLKDAAYSGLGRGREADADSAGLRYMAAAGYNTAEAPKVFDTFARLSAEVSTLEHFFHGSHPRARDRAKTIRSYLSQTPPKAGTRTNTKTYAKLTRSYRNQCPV